VGFAPCQSPPKEIPIYLCRHTHVMEQTIRQQTYNYMSHTTLLILSFIHTWVFVANVMEKIIRQGSYKVTIICHTHHYWSWALFILGLCLFMWWKQL
jgi:FtsH-binding integral membrane protein